MVELINQLGINSRIRIIQNPSREDVISGYHASEFLVNPSRWELSPLTPLEGFACKKTVVSTTAHGIPYTITDNENCLLVPPSNPQSLADVILELLQDPQKCNKLALSGFDMVTREGNLEHMSDAMFLVYEQTIQLKNRKMSGNT